MTPNAVISQKNQRVLILTSSTGGGHDAEARAFCEWASFLRGEACQVKIDQTLENSSPFYDAGVRFYNYIQQKAPWFHHVYWNLVEWKELLDCGMLSVGFRYYKKLLEEFQPDVVLSVHDCLNKGYFETARKILGRNVRCVTYCGEFQDGYGFSRNWVNPRADLFIGLTRETVQAAVRRGMPPGRAVCGGPLLRRNFYNPPLNKEKRKAYISQTLQLDPDRKILLLATGGAGAENHLSFLEAIKPFEKEIQAVALCGLNVHAHAQLNEWRAHNPHFKLCILPFSKEMNRLLQISFAVVTRGGMSTSAEALQAGCPILFNAIGGVMPQEHLTLGYFIERGIAMKLSRPFQLGQIIREWLEQLDQYEDLKKTFSHARLADAPKQIVQQILGYE
ncbi:MAG: glycosyltransferase [bacterium]